jgi:hypothetical protein
MNAPDPFALGGEPDDADVAENHEIAAIDFEPWDPAEIVKMQEDLSEPALAR